MPSRQLIVKQHKNPLKKRSLLSKVKKTIFKPAYKKVIKPAYKKVIKPVYKKIVKPTAITMGRALPHIIAGSLIGGGLYYKKPLYDAMTRGLNQAYDSYFYPTSDDYRREHYRPRAHYFPGIEPEDIELIDMAPISPTISDLSGRGVFTPPEYSPIPTPPYTVSPNPYSGRMSMQRLRAIEARLNQPGRLRDIETYLQQRWEDPARPHRRRR